MQTNSPIQVAIVDDDDVFRQNVEHLLASTNGQLGLIGSFASAETALRELPKLKPNVVLMDIALPKLSGVECVRELAPILPNAQIMMLTVSEDSERVFESLRAGATGYLLKRDVFEKLYSSIIELHEGGSPMTNSIARKVALEFRKMTPPPAGGKHLTQREEQILEALARGLLFKEVAEELGISFHTVRAHAQKILRKLQVVSRADAVRKFKGRVYVKKYVIIKLAFFGRSRQN